MQLSKNRRNIYIKDGKGDKPTRCLPGAAT
jgi:hypothetical protein